MFNIFQKIIFEMIYDFFPTSYKITSQTEVISCGMANWMIVQKKPNFQLYFMLLIKI